MSQKLVDEGILSRGRRGPAGWHLGKRCWYEVQKPEKKQNGDSIGRTEAIWNHPNRIQKS